jgi:membrane protein DedA with SNARE-associated domain
MFETTGWINHFPYLGLFLLLVLGGIGLPFPEDGTLILSGFLVAHGVLRPTPTFSAVYCGLLLSDYLLYWVGKRYGMRVLEQKRFRRMISRERVSWLKEKLDKRGIWIILIGRHLWGLRAQIFLVAGVVNMPRVKFLLADGVSALFTIAFMGGIGYVGGNSLQVIKKDITRWEHIAIVVIMALVSAWVVILYFGKTLGRPEKPLHEKNVSDLKADHPSPKR